MTPKNFLYGSVIFAVGLVIGFVANQSRGVPVLLKNVREESANYNFIDPLLFVKVLDDQFPEYIPLKKDLSSFVHDAIKDGKASDVSVFFRNLDGSQWMSINPDEKFSPASMLKVVTLISMLRAIQSNPKLASQKITIKGDDTELVQAQVWYPVENPIRSGNAYTIDTLLEHLVTESDNVANATLLNLIGNEKIMKTYEDLQLPIPNSQGTTEYTAEQYSHLFRALYNGTYLWRSSSEKALELLSKTKFSQGIVAGLPEKTIVSHKFGVRTVLSEKSTVDSRILSHRELHDCGIVYHPINPYFICIMTKGSDFSNLESVIQNLSQLVWEFQNTIIKE